MRSQPLRTFVMPVGSVMSWSNDLEPETEVRVFVGGGLVRVLAPGDAMDFLMHTVGTGR